jgi:lipopolysaccharide exporter
VKKHFSSYWIRSAFYSSLQRFSITFFGFVNFVVLIRHLSHDEMGVWALFLVITAIFEMAKTGLLKNAHIRFVTANEKEKVAVASSSLLINLFINLFFVLLIIFFSKTLSSLLHAGTDLAITLRWFIPGLIFMVFFSHFEAVQQSHLDFKGVFAGYFIRQLLFFLMIMVHPLFGIPFSLSQLALYQSVCIFIGTAVIYLYSRKYLLYQFNPTKEWIKKILSYGGYIFASGFVSNIFASVDQFMISKYISVSSVAPYNAASRINGLVDIPSYAAADILFPKASQASSLEGNQKIKYLYERMVAILISFTTPAALFIILFPKFVITVIAGRTYLEAAFILQLYMITGLLRPMQNQAANILNSIGKPKLCFIMNLFSLLIYVVINYICIKNFGFYGAAIGTLIACIAGAVAWYFVMKAQINLQLPNIFHYSIEFYRNLFSAVSREIKKRRKTDSQPITVPEENILS